MWNDPLALFSLAVGLVAAAAAILVPKWRIFWWAVLIIGLGLATFSLNDVLLPWRQVHPVWTSIGVFVVGGLVCLGVLWGQHAADPKRVAVVDPIVEVPPAQTPPPVAPPKPKPKKEDPVTKNKTTIGDIVNQGPGSIYQKGDNNTAIIGPPRLVMAQDQADYIASKLASFAGQKIEIVVDNGTNDTVAFARMLASACTKAGLKVDLKDHGIVLMLNAPTSYLYFLLNPDSSDQTNLATVVGRSIAEVGLIKGTIDAAPEKSMDHLMIYVRRPN